MPKPKIVRRRKSLEERKKENLEKRKRQEKEDAQKKETRDVIDDEDKSQSTSSSSDGSPLSVTPWSKASKSSPYDDPQSSSPQPDKKLIAMLERKGQKSRKVQVQIKNITPTAPVQCKAESSVKKIKKVDEGKNKLNNRCLDSQNGEKVKSEKKNNIVSTAENRLSATTNIKHESAAVQTTSKRKLEKITVKPVLVDNEKAKDNALLNRFKKRNIKTKHERNAQSVTQKKNEEGNTETDPPADSIPKKEFTVDSIPKKAKRIGVIPKKERPKILLEPLIDPALILSASNTKTNASARPGGINERSKHIQADTFNRNSSHKLEEKQGDSSPFAIEEIDLPREIITHKQQHDMFAEFNACEKTLGELDNVIDQVMNAKDDDSSEWIVEESFESFLTTPTNQYDFHDKDENEKIIRQPKIPMFPEDFSSSNNKKKEWPLSWWGIVEPPKELVRSIDDSYNIHAFQQQTSSGEVPHHPHNAHWHGGSQPPDRCDPPFTQPESQKKRERSDQAYRNSTHYHQPNQQPHYNHRPSNNKPPRALWGNNGAGSGNEGGWGKAHSKDYRYKDDNGGGWKGKSFSFSHKGGPPKGWGS